MRIVSQIRHAVAGSVTMQVRVCHERSLSIGSRGHRSQASLEKLLRRDIMMLSKVRSTRRIRNRPHATHKHSLACFYETSGYSYPSPATRSTRTTADTQHVPCREIQLVHAPPTMPGKPGLSPNSMTLFLHRGLRQ
jgi:hypothetical protein